MTDQDLHDERISRLYSMGEKPQPSAHLDNEILEAAHKAVRRPRLSLFWRLSATAAVLVLSIGVILRTLETVPVEEDFLEPSPEQTTKSQPQAVTEEAEEASVAVPIEKEMKPMPAAISAPKRERLEKRKSDISSAPRMEAMDAMPAPEKKAMAEPEKPWQSLNRCQLSLQRLSSSMQLRLHLWKSRQPGKQSMKQGNNSDSSRDHRPIRQSAE